MRDRDETAETTTTTNKRVVDVLFFTLPVIMTYLSEQKELDDDQHRFWQLVTRGTQYGQYLESQNLLKMAGGDGFRLPQSYLYISL